MKTFVSSFCLLLLLAALSGLAWAGQVDGPRPKPGPDKEQDAWADSPGDQRRAVPNKIAPPARLTPQTKLPPLPKEEQGTIRRVRLPTGEKLVALTFDMCELETLTTGYDAPMIRFLHEERLPATLFMGGKWMRSHAARVRQLMAEPLFEIGNHAWSHGNFGIMGPEQMREQLLWTQAQYELLREEALAGAAKAGRPVPNIPPVPVLFRLPYGRCSDAALELLAEQGFRVIQWDVAGEASGENNLPGQARDLAAKVRPGSILLFHANRVPRHAYELLREMVVELRGKGYRFVSVSDLLGLGEPERTRDGYFLKPGDNKALDTRFGVDGTGRRR